MGISFLRGTALGCALLVLAGCEELGLTEPADGASAAAGGSLAMVERDVESPEVFQADEAGLWDGRPSLGGVWVAHPDVTDPERVIVRNTANGQSVVGALFRRERANPGPRLQVSSDAADALGMLAGQPAELSVIALRREEVAEVAPVPAAVDGQDTVAVEGLAAPEEIESTSLAPLEQSAAAAIDAAETATVATPVAAPAPASSTLSRPFIQVGIFSVQANANRTAQAMLDTDLPARVVPGESAGNAFWRVIVGPASSEAQRAALLGSVKDAGFTDAYFVTD